MARGDLAYQKQIKMAENTTIERPEANKVYLGHTLDLLRSWPDNFIDCVVTSTPYYGMRSYGTEPQIWDAVDGCKHKWGKVIPNTSVDKRDPETKAKQNTQVGNNLKTKEHSNTNHGAFCSECGAWKGELGHEPDFRDFIRHLTQIFTEIFRCMKPEGTCWVNIDDCYTGSGKGGQSEKKRSENWQPKYPVNETARLAAVTKGKGVPRGPKTLPRKCLMNIPYRFAISMTDEVGFCERNLINWFKRACMPQSMKDRLTVDFEPIFFFTKNPNHYFEQQFEELAISTKNDYRANNEVFDIIRPERDFPGHTSRGSTMLKPSADGLRNMRTTWDVPYEPSSNKHYASYPTRLLDIPIKAGCPENGIVFDPFMGTGSTAVAAIKLGRRYLGCELQPDYHKILTERLGLEEEKGRLF